VDLRPFYELLTRETLIFSDLAAEGAASPRKWWQHTCSDRATKAR